MALDERSARELALAGDGTVGGGLPLPIVFTAVVQDLLDCGPADSVRLQKVVTASLQFKESRVFEVWETWEKFTDAILDQLCDDGVIARDDDDLFGLVDGFQPGRRYPVLPQWGMGVTVFRRADRKHRDDRAKAKMLVVEFANRLNQLGAVGSTYAAMALEWADELTEVSDIPEWDSRESEDRKDGDQQPPDGRKTGRRQKSRALRPKLDGTPHRRQGELTRMFNQFWDAHDDGQWHKLIEIARWWNTRHPEEIPVVYKDAGSWRTQARILVATGIMEVRQLDPDGLHPGLPPKEYRLVKSRPASG